MIENLSYENVTVKGGFWKARYDLNRNVSIPSVYKRFEESGRFNSMRFKHREGRGYPHIYYDSDVAKWVESISYVIKKCGGYQEEQQIIDALIEDMEKNQLPDGYLNSHFIQIEPDKRFTDRSAHELYCAGHLIEAAIAYDSATGKHKFLDVMLKYVDCIERYFVTEKLAKYSTCGHEEIEIALVKLFEYTENKRYLDLALFFIDQRGACDEEAVYTDIFNRKYDQSEMPLRFLEYAEGHAVRAGYIYTAMAEVAAKTNDRELLLACQRLWRDIVDRKMYVTGGIGSGKTGEAFTTAYDLPNLEAYSESCAAISLVLFALAMQKNELNAEYGAVIERILYNSLLSTTSIDGRSFFYENPLEIHMASVNKETSIQPKHRIKLPIRHRLEVFGCSCCPPNISRLFARMGDVFFSKYEESFVINQLGDVAYKDDSTEINITTDYPNGTDVVIDVEKCESKNILIRIPEWCEEYTLSCEYTVRDGYISVPGTQRRITLDVKMTPYFLECNPLSRANNGRVAVCYGPVVYCLERIDNEYELNAVSVDTDAVPRVEGVQDEYGMHSLVARGYLDVGFDSLYRRSKGETREVELRLRPYWTFANREETDMLVWIRRR